MCQGISRTLQNLQLFDSTQIQIFDTIFTHIKLSQILEYKGKLIEVLITQKQIKTLTP